MKKTGNENWTIGCYVVNAEINQISHRNRGGFSPYNLYYGKTNTKKTTINFGEVAMKNCKTEYGVICARELCVEAEKVAPFRHVTETELIAAMKKGKRVSVLYSIVLSTIL
jgi:hypothetical protein